MLFSTKRATGHSRSCPPAARFAMYPRLLLTSAVCLLQSVVAREIASHGNGTVPATTSKSSTTTTRSSTKTTTSTTTTTVKTRVTHVENEAIFGCRWPDDFIDRYVFCANKVSIDVGNVSTQSDIRYGVLSRTILDGLLDGCSRGELTKCVKKVDSAKLNQFLGRWSKDVGKYSAFQECLQSNTEAMDRLCGADTEVSRVVSGAAGLHLNLMNVLVRVKKERDESVNADAKITDDCMRKVAEAVHITAAMYIQSEHYMDNSVLCWNVVSGTYQCDAGCAAFAAELNCLQSDCATLPAHVLQEFGIWQWYFLNAAKSRQQCAVKDDQCALGQDAQVKKVTGIATLFDAALWRKKMREVAHNVESSLGIPVQVAIAITLAVLAAFCASCTAMCAYKYGLCGGDTQTRRYSRLDEGEGYGESSRSLTKTVDMDD